MTFFTSDSRLLLCLEQGHNSINRVIEVMKDLVGLVRAYMCVCSVVSSSLRGHGCSPSTKLLYSWNFPGYDTGVGYHFLLQGIFLTQGLNLRLLGWQAGSSLPSYSGSPSRGSMQHHSSRATTVTFANPWGGTAGTGCPSA